MLFTRPATSPSRFEGTSPRASVLLFPVRDAGGVIVTRKGSRVCAGCGHFPEKRRAEDDAVEPTMGGRVGLCGIRVSWM